MNSPLSIDPPFLSGFFHPGFQIFRKIEKKKTKKILVIDPDFRFARELKKRMERDETLQIILALDPLDAMDRMRVGNLDLIIMEWELPGFSGYDILAAAEKHWTDVLGVFPDSETKKIPVFILTDQEFIRVNFSDMGHFCLAGVIYKSRFSGKVDQIISRHFMKQEMS